MMSRASVRMLLRDLHENLSQPTKCRNPASLMWVGVLGPMRPTTQEGGERLLAWHLLAPQLFT